MASLHLRNPSINPNPSVLLPLNRTSVARYCTSISPDSPFRPYQQQQQQLLLHRISIVASSVRGPKLTLPQSIHLYTAVAHNHSLAAFAVSSSSPSSSSHEDSKSSELELEHKNNEVKQSNQVSEELWEQVLATFKEQALKLQSDSQEAYEVFYKKALVLLKETADELKIHADKAKYDLGVITRELSQEVLLFKEAADELKIHADKAKHDLGVITRELSQEALVLLKETADKLKIHADKAKYDLGVITRELSQEGKQYLTIAAENSPESVKDVVETFASSADDVNNICQLRDFYIGIPYGAILSLGGILNFMLTGSISSIRFGVILGGSLLALSVISLRSWKKGETSKVALKGQTVIAGILFLRDARLFSQGQTFTRLLMALISAAVASFFAYRIAYGKQLQD